MLVEIVKLPTLMGDIQICLNISFDPDVRKETYGFSVRNENVFLKIILLNEKSKLASYEVDYFLCLYVELYKYSNIDEPIQFKIELLPNEMVDIGIDGGENVEAIEITSDNFIMHIGTEDSESLKNRAQQNWDIPERFADQLGFNGECTFSLSNRYKAGFYTSIPTLLSEEAFCFHYIVSLNSKTGENFKVNSDATWLNLSQNLFRIKEINKKLFDS